MTDPVEKTILVPLPPRSAFDLFTDGMGSWWPLESHSLSGDAQANVTVEPQEGGRIFETKPDGTRADWATITEWQPGAFLAFDWYVGRDPAEATQVSIRFIASGNGTRIDLVHDGFDRLAGGAEMRQGYNSGWEMVLGARYHSAALAQVA